MNGTVVIDTEQEVSLRGTITSSGTLSGSVINDVKKLTGHVAVNSEHEVYSGEYDITPKIEPQVLSTSDKLMTQDMTVKAIPYYSVSNEHNGETIIIGGNN